MKLSILSFVSATALVALVGTADCFQIAPGTASPLRRLAYTAEAEAVTAEEASDSVAQVNPSIVDEAISIYQRKFPEMKDRVRPAYKLVSFGMPDTDIDGSRFKMKDDGTSKNVVGTTFSERPESYLRDTFTLLANLYGEQQALQMVKDVPICLAFDNKNFEPALAEFSKKFGNQESREMIQRNPGLLAIKATGAGGASTASDQTMIFSYLVAVTRPVGPILLYGTIFLVSYPFIAALFGLPLPNH
jgi:hypothetical protein